MTMVLLISGPQMKPKSPRKVSVVRRLPRLQPRRRAAGHRQSSSAPTWSLLITSPSWEGVSKITLGSEVVETGDPISTQHDEHADIYEDVQPGRGAVLLLLGVNGHNFYVGLSECAEDDLDDAVPLGSQLD